MIIELVPMQKRHIADIAEIERLCFSHPRSENSLFEELGNDTAVYYCALCDNKIAGYGGMNTVLDEAYISNIAVAPKFRRLGVASKIIDELIKHCIEGDFAFITLEVRPSNKAAISLYEKFGFKRVGQRKNFYTAPTENADLMTLFFDESERK